MKSKRLFACTSTLFLVPLCAALVFVSENDVSFLSLQANDSNDEYSLTIDDYDGGNYQTYYTTKSNPLVFEFSNCTPSEDGLALVTSDSIITCTTPVHGITSLLVTTNQPTFDTYVHFTIFKEIGSVGYVTTPNQKTIIDISSTGFAVYFEGSDFLATALTFTYTCN